MDGVPLKVPQVVSQEVKQQVKVNVPDYLSVLQETEVNVVEQSEQSRYIKIIPSLTRVSM